MIARPTRLVIAGIAAPLGPLLLILLPQLTGRGRLDLSDWHESRVIIVILLGAYLLAVAVGVPAYFTVRRYFRQTWFAYLAAAFVSGACSVPLTIAGILLWGFTVAGTAKLVAAANLFGGEISQIMGASVGIGLLFAPVGLLFWVIARPDRD